MYYLLNELRKYKFVFWWRLFTGLVFSLILLRLGFFAREVTYIYKEQFQLNNANKIELEIDLCYRSHIETDYCKEINGLKYSKRNKTKFNNRLETSIGCYTIDFRFKTVKKIIKEIESWNISNLSSVDCETKNGIKKVGIEHFLYDRQICLKHKFEILGNSTGARRFLIKNSRNLTFKTYQNFKGYLTMTRTYEKGERYSSKKIFFIKRECWMNNKTYECTETNKNITFLTYFFSIKLNEYPYETDCVIREYSENNGTQKIFNRNSCYESCFKKRSKIHFLTYRSIDNFTLNYNQNFSQFKYMIKECPDCTKLDCKITTIFIPSIETTENDDSNNSSNDGQIIVKLFPEDYRYESIPLFSFSKLFWMITALISTFFGINFYQLLLKLTNLNDSFARKIKAKKNSKKLLFVSSLIFLIGLNLSLIIESKFFNFGLETNEFFLRKESFEERNVSVSICFKLCDILNQQQEKCNDEIMKNKTIGQLIDMTWDENSFRQKASIRNSARVYPIRQISFRIPMFFRNLKKCYLLSYKSKRYWNHYPLQRFSRIGINITDVKYAHFYIEDGINVLPKIDAQFTRRSSLHALEIVRKKKREGCIDYKTYYNDLKLITKDDHIQDCIIEETSQNLVNIPMNMNLRIINESSKYSNLYFSDKKDEKSITKCENKFKSPECESIRTSTSFQNILEVRDNISINLTPFIYEMKSNDDESALIILNRILSFLIILIGFSLKDYFQIIISFFFFAFFRFYDFQYVKNIFYSILSILFLLHLLLLCHFLINPIFETSHFQLVDEIKLPIFRFCYLMNIDLDSYKYTFNRLENETFDLSEIFNDITIIDDDHHKTIGRLDLQKDTQTNQSFMENKKNYKFNDSKIAFITSIYHYYFDDLKCFNFNIRSSDIPRRLSLILGKLNKIFTISFNITKLKNNKLDKFFIFMNSQKGSSRDFDWNMPIESANYEFELVDYDFFFQDDYFFLKNFFSSFINLFKSNLTNNAISYLNQLVDDFKTEQFATTTLVPLLDNESYYIKNDQFNYYIQFRSISTNRNDYDFSRNYHVSTIGKNFFLQRNDSNSDKLTMTLNLSMIKYQLNCRNRYRYTEFGFHLFILLCAYFKVNFISLPKHYKDAYPFIRSGIIHFLYYLVCLIVLLFDIGYMFIKFLNIIQD